MKFRFKLLAVIIGFLSYTLLYLIVCSAAGLIFNDKFIFFVMQCLCIFLGSAISGSLMQQNGWLYGALANFLSTIGLILIIANSIFHFFSPNTVINNQTFFFVLVSIIAGITGEKFSYQIRKFSSQVFAWIAGISLFFAQIGGGLLYLYFLYLGGKMIFEYHNFIMGLLYIFIIGPIVSGIFGLITQVWRHILPNIDVPRL